jgi:uncharacterized DUF497 family protein
MNSTSADAAPDEPRWLLVGKIDQKHWSAVITRRGENVRLISVRRSRDEEVTIYESHNADSNLNCRISVHRVIEIACR